MGEGDPQSTDTITREQILARARSFIGHGTYKLGRGGFNPASPTPWATSSELCDCSGFVSWCINAPRENPAIDGGWIETTAMVADARGPHGLFTLVDGAAQPGDILVYGDHRVRASDQHLVFQQGHTGIVSQVDAVGHPYKAIHCSKGNFERLNHAIEETSANIFLCNNAVVIRPNKVVVS